MQHAHHHDGHSHAPKLDAAQAGSNAFRLGIALNLIYVVAETVAGLRTDSLALLSDAGHNLSDVASLFLSLFAFYLARRRATAQFTYGYRKSTVLAALANAMLLLVAVGIIGYEAILRMGNPQPLPGGIIAWVAGIGIFVNLGSALLFRRKGELNARSAYLHLMADALVSAGVVLAGILIRFTQWYVLDTVVSLLICVVILVAAWGLLRDSLRLSIDAVPAGIELEALERTISGMPGVRRFTHIHVWAISTTENALTAHVCIDPGVPDPHRLVAAIKHELLHLSIQHATIEIDPEPEDGNCSLTV